MNHVEPYEVFDSRSQSISLTNHRFLQCFFVFFAAVFFAYWRFLPWEPKVFFADDLYALWAFYDGTFSSTIHQALTGAIFEKYRPIFQLICYVLFSVFGKSLTPYLAFNLIVQGLNAVLFFLIASKLSYQKFFVPFILTLAFASSRLALYQITQIIGPVESIALTFFLGMLYCLLRSLNTPKPNVWQYLAIAAIALSMYTHERYIVVLPWLAAVLFFSSSTDKNTTLTSRCTVVFFCIALLVSNIIIKYFILHIHFFVGTGGYNISIDYPMIMAHIHEAFFSILGFNTGPAYLIGNAMDINPFALGNDLLIYLMATIFSLSVLAINTWSMMMDKNKNQDQRFYVLGFISLIILLLLPPILTIRVEGRWEYAPFALILLSLARGYGLSTQRGSKHSIAACCWVASIAIMLVDNHIITQSFDRIYMVGWAKFGNAIKTDMIPAFSKQSSNDMLLLADPEACGTVKINRLFELYTQRKPIIYCANTQEELSALMNEHPEVLAFKYSALKFMQYNESASREKSEPLNQLNSHSDKV